MTILLLSMMLILMHYQYSEEGARFPKSMTASGVWAGAIPLQEAWDLPDVNDQSVTQRTELEKHGYLGDMTCSSSSSGFPLSAHFELHIEQGPILQESGRSIGIVQGAQAYRWLTFTVYGRDAHTGTTPFKARKDPLLAACRMIAASNDIAKRHNALASTGIFKLPSNVSTNTIASQVSFTLDIRHPHDSVVHACQEDCLKAFADIAAPGPDESDGKGVVFDWSLDTDSAAVHFDKKCITSVQEVAHELVGPDFSMPLTSGAGHDSVYTNKRVPTSMIFVPCRDGISHHPAEYCSPEHWLVPCFLLYRLPCLVLIYHIFSALGAQTLLEAVVHYDRNFGGFGYQ